MAMFKLKRLKIFLLVIGSIIGVIGISGILGYVLNIKTLYFSIENISAPMAINTAFLLLLVGIGFAILGICRKDLIVNDKILSKTV